ncbi:reverse transcriptase domain-containing protein [Tanacetum coccineum]
MDERSHNLPTGSGMRPLGRVLGSRGRSRRISRPKDTRFLGEQVKPLEKIELDVCFGGSGLCQRAIMKFTIILEPSPYNIILGRPSIKQLRAIPSTIHGMMKREGKNQGVDRPEETEPQEKAREIPHLDIKPSLGQEGGRKLEDVYRLQEHQFRMSERLLPVERNRQQDRVSCGYSTQMLSRRIQRLPPSIDGRRRRGENRLLHGSSNSKMEMLADIAKTFDNLRRINMKLNLKKCSFRVDEGKFLGYMVTSEGIRANPTKTKDIAEMQSPKTWGDMQSLTGELATLNRFLSRSAEKSLPFFKTLKDITKENKHDYRWTEKTEYAFQELKKMILDLSVLTTTLPKETLFVYLAASKEAVSVVLLVVRKGKKRPVHYVSRTLHDVERNYAPLEKIALALWHISKRLRRYFEAHPITVITDQPIKQILNKADTSGRMNTLYRWGIKCQRLRCGFGPHQSYKDRIYICPETQLRSTNNQDEYEALLAGFRTAKKMGVQSLSVNVDSKLVAIQINGNYEACKETMIRYLSKAKEYISCFKKFKIQNIPRSKNQKAGVLSKLASVAFNHLTKEVLVETLDVLSMDVEEINAIVEEEGETWMTPIVIYLEKGVWPEDQNKACALRMKIGQYVMKEGFFIQKILPNAYAPPFFQWGMDVLGPLPEAPGKVKFVIVAIDYFTKWIEAKSLAKTTRKEVVILAEIGMPRHRTIMIKEGEGNEEEMRLNLDLITERREATAVREARYKMKMEQYYNKRVRPVSFKVGEYVYRKNEASRVENLES